jgi:hypothetical protein
MELGLGVENASATRAALQEGRWSNERMGIAIVHVLEGSTQHALRIAGGKRSKVPRKGAPFWQAMLVIRAGNSDDQQLRAGRLWSSIICATGQTFFSVLYVRPANQRGGRKNVPPVWVPLGRHSAVRLTANSAKAPYSSMLAVSCHLSSLAAGDCSCRRSMFPSRPSITSYFLNACLSVRRGLQQSTMLAISLSCR